MPIPSRAASQVGKPVKGNRPPRIRAVVPRTPPCAARAFGFASFVVAPSTPPFEAVPAVVVFVVPAVFVTDEVLFVVELLVLLVELLVLLLVELLGLLLVELLVLFCVLLLLWLPVWLDVELAVGQLCLPALYAWTSGPFVPPGHVTLCGWLLPGP
jgi:hypothetical protein